MPGRLLLLLLLLLATPGGALVAVEYEVVPASWEQVVDLTESDAEAELSDSMRESLAEESDEFVVDESADSQADDDSDELSYDLKYNNGILVEVYDDDDQIFQLRTNGRIQFRFVGFSRDIESYTNNAGVTVPVRNRSRFDIERARLIFSGNVFNKNWRYFLQLDGDTDRGSTVIFFDYWWGYKFCEPLEIRVGKAKVSASRQWLMTAFETRLVDRPIATDFFRPDRTQGIWAVGKLGPAVKYQAMIGNGYRTANLTPQQVNTKFATAGFIGWEPLGDFGSTIVDFAWSECLLTQFGFSMAHAQESGFDNSGNLLAESRYARLSDGTVLVSPNALAAGVTVDAYDTLLFTVDGAAKYRGWSINAEYYFRTIDNLQANGALPLASLDQHGGFVEGGRFLVPQTLDVNARYSRVNGEFGSSTEYAGGIGYYPRCDTSVKFTFDATWLSGAPATVTGSDILVGDRGMLYRAQFQARF